MPGHHSIFQSSIRNYSISENIDNLLYTKDLGGFGQNSIRIAIGAIAYGLETRKRVSLLRQSIGGKYLVTLFTLNWTNSRRASVCT